MAQRIKSVTVTTTAGAYSANDVVGGLIPCRIGLNEGFLDDIVIIDTDDVGAAFNVYVFEERPTDIADNAAFTLSDDDAKKLIGVYLAVNSYTDVGGAKIVSLAQFFSHASLMRPFVTKTLYFYLQCTGTPTFVASLVLKISAHS